MAREKLGQRRASGDYDLVVVDTPPTRSALDFLDAPQRLTTFLDGRMIRILLAPAKASGKAYLKVVTAGCSVFTGGLTKLTGGTVRPDGCPLGARPETRFARRGERWRAT